MPPDLVTERDVELIIAGLGCVAAAGWFGFDGRSPEWQPLLVFALLAGTSFGLVAWDVHSRRGTDGVE